MIKAIVFDLYETLVTQTATVVPRAGALGKSLGLDAMTIRNCMTEDVVAWPQSAFAPQLQCAVFSYIARAVKPGWVVRLSGPCAASSISCQSAGRHDAHRLGGRQCGY